MRGRRRRVAAFGALTVGCIAVAVLVTTLLSGESDSTSRAASTSTATTEIRRQDLVEVQSEDGTLGYSDEREVVNRLSGTVTQLPKKGKVVKADQELFRVDKTPVILLDGRIPAYRTLKSGVSDGADVEQLENNLRSLGYDSGGAISVDQEWTSATTAAVKRWQDAHGFSQTGAIGLGRVIFQPGARRVASVEATLGGDATQGSSSSPTTGASYLDGQATMSFASTAQADEGGTTTPEQQTTTPEQQTTTPEQQTTTPEKESQDQDEKQEQETQPQQQQQQSGAQTQQAPSGSGSSGSSAAGGSSSGGSSSGGGGSSEQNAAAASVLTTTSTTSVVKVDLDTSKQALAKKGAGVTVELPSGGSARGTISSVGKVAEKAESSDGATSGGTDSSSSSSSSSTEDATIPVTVRLSSKTTALDQAPATVRFEQSRRKDVLAIPVTALLAQSGGKFAVEVRDGGSRRLVAVEPGLYTSGYVEISGRGLRPGTKVTDARV